MLQHKRTAKRRGPQPNPLSAKQITLALRAAKKIRKLETDHTLASCTWATSSRGGLRDSNEPDVCCKSLMCCESLIPERDGISLSDVVLQLRQYYAQLDKVAKRLFWEHRTTLNKDRLSDEMLEASNIVTASTLFLFSLSRALSLHQSTFHLSYTGRAGGPSKEAPLQLLFGARGPPLQQTCQGA